MGCAGSKGTASEPPAENGQGEEWLKRQQDVADRVAQRHEQRAHAAARSRRGAPSGGQGGGGSNLVATASSLGSSGSGSEVASDWDRYSWRPEPHARLAAASASPSPSLLTPRDALTSFSTAGSLGSQLKLRQDSLFGLGGPPHAAAVRDSERLRLCKVSGITFVNQYMVIKYLGRGSSGRVFLCLSLEDYRLYAVKIVKKDAAAQRGKASRSGRAGPRNPLEDLAREVAVMRAAAHPNVVALREVVDDSASNKMLLVMDYYEGGPVMTREGLERGHRIPEEVARLYFRDMCRALDYLHTARRVVHGDLKPENALMGAAGRVALSDFGCSKVLTDSEARFDRCNGTPAFLAPEMMRPNARYRGRPADVYALGACLFSFVFGRIPFRADTVLQLFEVVQGEPLAFPDQPPVTAELRDLLQGMLEKDPERRLSLAQAMQHPWTAAGGALPPLRAGHEEEAAAAAAERPPACSAGFQAGSGEGEDAEGGPELEQVLREALQGLAAVGAAVLSFSRGEQLMTRGEPGSHLLFILEGECEVHYRTAAPPAGPGSQQPGQQPSQQPSQQPGQQPQDRHRSPPPPGHHPEPPTSSHGRAVSGGAPAAIGRRSPAAVFAADSCAGGGGGSSLGEPALSAAEEVTSRASLSLRDEMLEQAGTSLLSRRTSSCLAESASAAVHGRTPGGAAGQQQGAPPSRLQRLESTASSAPPLALPPLPPPGGPGQPPGPPPDVGTPAEGLHREPATPGAAPGLSQRERPWAEAADQAGTPDAPAAAEGLSAATPSPGPYGLQRQLGLELESAAEQLFTPGPPSARSSHPPAAPEEQQGTPQGTPQGTGAPPSLQGPAEEPGQQRQQRPGEGREERQPQEGRGAEAKADGEAEGLELPASLLEAASRARELLGTLRRGPRLFLAARRGPGDIVGEMEALNGSQSRRLATVVAASGGVRAALVPYPAAKAYLARCPLAKQQLAQLMWLRQSETLVLEALARLAAVGDDVARQRGATTA